MKKKKDYFWILPFSPIIIILLAALIIGGVLWYQFSPHSFDPTKSLEKHYSQRINVKNDFQTFSFTPEVYAKLRSIWNTEYEVGLCLVPTVNKYDSSIIDINSYNNERQGNDVQVSGANCNGMFVHTHPNWPNGQQHCAFSTLDTTAVPGDSDRNYEYYAFNKCTFNEKTWNYDCANSTQSNISISYFMVLCNDTLVYTNGHTGDGSVYLDKQYTEWNDISRFPFDKCYSKLGTEYCCITSQEYCRKVN